MHVVSGKRMISICQLGRCRLWRSALPALALLLGALAPAARAQSGDSTVYVVTYIDIQPEATGKALALLHRYRATSRKEAGNSEVELAQEIGRASRFVVIEAWRDPASFDAHGKSAATVQFHDALKAIHHSPYDQRVAHGFAVAPAPARGALYVVTHVDVTPPNQAQTEIVLRQLAEESRRDAGNLRYDVFQQNAPRTNHFAVVALWKDRKAFAAHEASAHRLATREKLAPMLGALYDENKQKTAGVREMERAIQLNPGNAAALNYLGYTYAEDGRNLNEAEQLVKRALDIEPEDGFYIDSLGWVYYQKGQYAKAVVQLQRAVNLTSDDPTIAEHLGDAYRKLGRELDARQEYQLALKKSSDSEQVERLKGKLQGLQNVGDARQGR